MSALENGANRRRWLIALVLVVMAIYALFGVRDARSAQRRLSQAQADLGEVAQKLAEIERLGFSTLQSRLKEKLDLRTSDQARTERFRPETSRPSR